jgi:hypothetical protein
MNAGEPTVLYVLLASCGTALLIYMAVQLVVCWMLCRAANSIPGQFREVTPGTAYLLIIPLFGIAWVFVYTKQLSRSFQALFRATGHNRGDCGENLGMWWGVCSAFGYIPYLGLLVRIGELIVMILYVMKVNAYRDLAEGIDGSALSHNTSESSGVAPLDDDNPYSTWG